MIQILLVDDHQVVREGLKRILADSYGGAHFGEAGDYAQAMARLGEATWDIVLLDVSLPGRNGLDLLREIRRLHEAVPVLMLSMHPEEEFAVRAVRSGAAGYLTKDSAADELVKAVGVILEGGRYISSTLAACLASSLSLGTGEERSHERLSDREFLVLRMMASGKGTTEIASELSVSVPTVNTYRARIFRKMGMTTRAQLVRYCLDQGLIT